MNDELTLEGLAELKAEALEVAKDGVNWSMDVGCNFLLGLIAAAEANAPAQPVADAAPVEVTHAMAMAVRKYDVFDPLSDRALVFVAKSIYRDMQAAAQPSPAQGDAKLIERLTHERDALGKAIADAALKAGIWNGEVRLTGPHLLMFADDLADCAKAAQGDALSQQADPELPAGEREAWRIGRAAGIEEAAKAAATIYSGNGGPPDDPHPDSVIHNGAVHDCVTVIRALATKPAEGV